MQKFNLPVDHYTLSVELKHLKSPVMGYFSLWNGTTRVGDFRFIRNENSLNPLRLEDGVIVGDISNINRDEIVDILRNEKPLRLLAWSDGERIISIRLATSDIELEPIGEGE